MAFSRQTGTPSRPGTVATLCWLDSSRTRLPRALQRNVHHGGAVPKIRVVSGVEAHGRQVRAQSIHAHRQRLLRHKAGMSAGPHVFSFSTTRHCRPNNAAGLATHNAFGNEAGRLQAWPRLPASAPAQRPGGRRGAARAAPSLGVRCILWSSARALQHTMDADESDERAG